MRLQVMLRGRYLLAIVLQLLAAPAFAQFSANRGPMHTPFQPPPFVGGVPGVIQMQAFNQRHQARTVLYREALDQLRKNPHAADVPECSTLDKKKPEDASAGDSKAREPKDRLCLKTEPTMADAVPPGPAQTPVPPATPRRIAVLVGNNAYATPIPVLETPVADVESIGQVLRSRFGFEPRLIHNAGKARIIEVLNEIATTTRPEDSVLLLYAGHGYLMNDINMGFWIPVDGSNKSPANWISNADIAKMLKAIPARQLILVSDSCFSGSLTKEQKFTAAAGENRDEILRLRSVIAFSSGDEEPVSDEGKEGHSAFAYNFIKALESVTALTPGYRIYSTVRTKVSAEYEQTPQYGAVVSAGHRSGGEYLFEPHP